MQPSPDVSSFKKDLKWPVALPQSFTMGQSFAALHGQDPRAGTQLKEHCWEQGVSLGRHHVRGSDCVDFWPRSDTVLLHGGVKFGQQRQQGHSDSTLIQLRTLYGGYAVLWKHLLLFSADAEKIKWGLQNIFVFLNLLFRYVFRLNYHFCSILWTSNNVSPIFQIKI